MRISQYKNIFAKGYTLNLSEEIFVIKKIKNTVPWTYVINDLMVKKLLEKLYVKWKGYDNSFNSWNDKKRLRINESILS